MRSHRVAGILLTGGASRRMGFDKATMLVGDEPCAARTARALAAVADPVLEVGPGVAGIPVVHEQSPGQGPLAAVAAGSQALGIGADASCPGAAVVVACDLPLVTASVLEALARWPGDASVVPVIEGHAQPLCARWSADDLLAAAALVDDGHRAMRPLLERPGVRFVDESQWPGGLDRRAFADADTPDDLDRLGVAWSPA